MMLSLLAPVAFLSIFPHQEPRFIIPVIIPLIYLCGESMWKEYDQILIKHESTTNNTIEVKNRSRRSTVLLKLWLILNCLCVLFYGFIHQGGVYKAANYLSKEINSHSKLTEYHIITSHTYSIPKTLFIQKSTTIHSLNDKTNSRVFLYEFGSLDLEVLYKKINEIIKMTKVSLQNNRNKKIKMFLVISGSEIDLNLVAFGLHKNRLFDFKDVAVFYPHVSVEAFPDLAELILYFFHNIQFDNGFYVLRSIVSAFGLKLYQIAPSY